MKNTHYFVPAIFLITLFLAGCSNAIDFSTLPTLPKMVLTIDDVQEKYSAEVSNTIFFREPKPVESDTTKELSDGCVLDCVKKIWHVSNSSSATITLIRLGDSDAAKKQVQDEIATFSQENSSVHEFNDDGFQKRNISFRLPDYTYIAVLSSNSSTEYYLVTNRGPVMMIITDELFIKPGVTDIDDWSHALSLQFLAKLQTEKLRTNGYP